MLLKVSKLGYSLNSLALSVWEEQRTAERGRNMLLMNKRLCVFEMPTMRLGLIVQCCNFLGELSEVVLSLAKQRTATARRLSAMMDCFVACLVAVHSQIV